jgi:carbamoyl-phosphate synthase/aspartate carbamoyltransferase/dihydroorotase
VHVHLRDPGATHKEDFGTGTAAALAGGVVAVLDMPNNTPPTVNGQRLTEKAQIASEKAHCDFGFYLGATEDNAGDGATLSHRVAGLKIYMGQTYGPLKMAELAALMAHFQSWPADRPIVVHAEGLAMAGAIALARLHGKRLHICHVSRKAEIELVRKAKENWSAKADLKLTCEVTPHHLFLTLADVARLGNLAYVKPPLGTAEDRAALWDNLDIVDVIASDHAPHTIAEKEGPEPPPGVPGLETTLPLLLTAVADGRLSWERLIELTSENPARIFGLKRDERTYIEVDPDDRYVLNGSSLRTKCGWTPFEGMTVRGRVVRVYLRGALAYADGQVLVQPGFGQALYYRKRKKVCYNVKRRAI